MAIYKIKIQFAVLWFNLNSFEEKTLQESRYQWSIYECIK